VVFPATGSNDAHHLTLLNGEVDAFQYLQ